MLANPCTSILYNTPNSTLLSRFPHSKLGPSPPCHRFPRKPEQGSLSFILRRKQSKGFFGIKASEEHRVSESVASTGAPFFPESYSVKIPVGDRHVSWRNLHSHCATFLPPSLSPSRSLKIFGRIFIDSLSSYRSPHW